VIDKRPSIQCVRLNALVLVLSARTHQHAACHHEYADNGDMIFQHAVMLSFHNGRLYLDAPGTTDAEH
jgi:hypothetical protein